MRISDWSSDVCSSDLVPDEGCAAETIDDRSTPNHQIMPFNHVNLLLVRHQANTYRSEIIFHFGADDAALVQGRCRSSHAAKRCGQGLVVSEGHLVQQILTIDRELHIALEVPRQAGIDEYAAGRPRDIRHVLEGVVQMVVD